MLSGVTSGFAAELDGRVEPRLGQDKAGSGQPEPSGSCGSCCFEGRDMTMARVLIGGRRGVVIRGGGLGGMVLGLVLRRVVRQQARNRASR